MKLRFWKRDEEKIEKEKEAEKKVEVKEVKESSDLNAKIELLLTKIESLRINQETVNERVKNIEKIIKELYEMAKS